MASKFKRTQLQQQRERLGDEAETERRLMLDTSHPQVRKCVDCGLPGCMFRDFPRWSKRCNTCGPEPKKKPPPRDGGRAVYEFGSDYIPPEKRSGRRARKRASKIQGIVR